MIKVIVFDYADVLAEGPISKWRNENKNLDKKKLVEYKQYSGMWDVGEMSLKQMYKHLSLLTGIAEDNIWKNIYNITKPNNELINLIKKLKNDYKIIVFSNFVSEQLYALLDKFNITSLFDEIIVSSDYGLKKPDPKFYKLLVEKSGVNIDEILFTDDNFENVNAANKFGIKSFVFTNTENFIKDLQKEGVKT